ncbi:hypothetical protein D3C79_863790 [compost metagenome]
MSADIEGRDHLPGSVVHRDGNRTQPLLEFLVDNAPALLSHLLQTFEQRLGGVDRAAGLGLQFGVVEVFAQRGVIQRGQQDPPHRGAIGRQAPAHRQVHRNQPLGGRGARDVQNVITLQRGHVAGLVQLLAHAVQVRLGGNRQRR